MKARLCIGIAAIILLMVGGISSAQATSSPEGDFPSEKWKTGYISTDPNAGEHVSIAIDEEHDNAPWVAYYNQTYGSLMAAHYVGAGNGNCDANSAWKCEQVDYVNGEFKGMFTSIDIFPDIDPDPQFSTWKVGISYYDATQKSLKYAKYACTPIGNCSWTISTVDSSADASDELGRYTSLKFDSDGIAHISYHVITDSIDPTRTEMVKYASYIGGGDGNCGEAYNWVCEVIADAFNMSIGMYTSLDLDWQNKPYISFYDGTYSNLWYAYYAGSGGDCGTEGDWECRSIDTNETADVGRFSSLHAPQNAEDYLQVAYFNATTGMLMYAYDIAGSGNCGEAGDWYCSPVDYVGELLTQMGISLAVDVNNNTLIAYTDGHDDFAPIMLKVASPATDMPYANCGGELFYSFYCRTVDDGYQDIYEAEFAGLAIKPNGLAVIAYTETDQSDYPAQTNLKIAYQMARILLPLVVK
jgi:hypothetical protein